MLNLIKVWFPPAVILICVCHPDPLCNAATCEHMHTVSVFCLHKHPRYICILVKHACGLLGSWIMHLLFRHCQHLATTNVFCLFPVVAAALNLNSDTEEGSGVKAENHTAGLHPSTVRWGSGETVMFISGIRAQLCSSPLSFESAVLHVAQHVHFPQSQTFNHLIYWIIWIWWQVKLQLLW